MDDDLAAILADAGMDANHPLFARAQAALQTQQEKQKTDLEDNLREKANELRVRHGPNGCLTVALGGFMGIHPDAVLPGRPAAAPRRWQRRNARTSVWSYTTSSSSWLSCR